jgi:hypothetical protein
MGGLGRARDGEETVDHRVDLLRHLQLAGWQKCPDPTVLPYRISEASSWKRAMSEPGFASSAAM